ncbi:phosphoglycerol transferase [Jannaschia faecimaris]|uniref:Phosphoglycerol transferase n=1 Tax=Jannaschia faecimaris TaxID=1244108 RepID=A0A1H3UEA0_9RHOB|nr:sulfatase-like hydrolase/transferase [Jannaschia faecimaris]SDZ60371.1 phosphoglycerol transferase [Jannaschia faecimaris]
MTAKSLPATIEPRQIARLLIIVLPGLMASLFVSQAFLQVAKVNWVMGLIVVGLLVPTSFLKSPLTGRPLKWKGIGFPLLLLATALIIPVTAIILVFGKADFFAIFVNVALGVAGIPWAPYVPHVLTALVLWGAILVMFYRLRAVIQVVPAGWFLSAIVVLGVNPVLRDLTVNRYYALMGQPTSLMDRHVEPQVVANPDAPSLVFIFLEGFDRQYHDARYFGDVAAPVRRLEETSLAFTNVDQLAGTGWSIAGHAAAYCGLPLSPRFSAPSESSHILKDAACLPNVLHDLGYEQTYFSGTNKSQKNHFGFQNFFDDRQINTIFDSTNLTPISGEAPDDSVTSIQWGLFDSDLMPAISDGVDAAVAAGGRFAIYASTTDMHGPTAGLSPSCTEDGRGKIIRDMLVAAECVSGLIHDFVTRFERDHGDRNILLVIASDHLGHKSDALDIIPEGERRNLLFMRGPGIEPDTITRRASMLDVFPTILDVMGLLGPDSASAGLGQSLLRETPTLAEQYDNATFESLLTKDAALANFVWTEKN